MVLAMVGQLNWAGLYDRLRGGKTNNRVQYEVQRRENCLSLAILLLIISSKCHTNKYAYRNALTILLLVLLDTSC